MRRGLTRYQDTGVPFEGPPPDAPTGLTATAIAYNQVDLAWTDVATNETRYRIYRSETSVSGPWIRIASIGADSESYSDYIVDPSTQYWYYVGAYNPAGEADSNVDTATTDAIPIPDAPIDLSISNIAWNLVSLAWTDIATVEDGYKVYRSEDDVVYAEVADLAADATSYTDTTVSPSTLYYYKVAPYNISGEADSSTVSDTTDVIPLPAAPVLVVFNFDYNFVSLQWNNVALEDGYRVYRSPNGVDTWSELDDLAADSTSYSDTTVSDDTSYWYKVASYNTTGEADSNIEQVDVPLLPSVPLAPTSLSVTAPEMTRVELTWTDNATTEDGYHVYRASPNAGPPWTEVADLPAGSEAWTDNTVVMETTYHYGVAAYNAEGDSIYLVGNVTTPGEAPESLSPEAQAAMVSWWKLDEQVGVRYDTHGANNLTDNNTVGYEVGKKSNAADFEKDNSEYLSHVDTASLRGGAQDFAIAFWFKPESSPAWDAYISKSHDSAREYLIRIGGTPGKPQFEVGNGASSLLGEVRYTGTAMSNGEWYFIVAWHDVGASTVYLQLNNGTIYSDTYSGSLATSTKPFLIGSWDTGGNSYADGLFDEVVFWQGGFPTAEDRTFLYNDGAGRIYEEAMGLPWSPLYIETLANWWDGSDITTLYTDVNGTTPVTVDGDNVYYIDDKSGYHMNLVGSASSQKYTENVQNGLAVIRQLTNTFYYTSEQNMTLSGAITLLYVAKHTIDNSIGWGFSSTHQVGVGIRGTPDVLSSYLKTLNPQNGIGTTNVLNTWQVFVVHMLPSFLNFYIGGGIPDKSTAKTGTVLQTLLSNIGWRTDAAIQRFQGEFGEMLLFNSELSVEDVNLVGNYLGTKWGLTWTDIA